MSSSWPPRLLVYIWSNQTPLNAETNLQLHISLSEEGNIAASPRSVVITWWIFWPLFRDTWFQKHCCQSLAQFIVKFQVSEHWIVKPSSSTVFDDIAINGREGIYCEQFCWWTFLHLLKETLMSQHFENLPFCWWTFLQVGSLQKSLARDLFAQLGKYWLNQLQTCRPVLPSSFQILMSTKVIAPVSNFLPNNGMCIKSSKKPIVNLKVLCPRQM